MTVRRDKPVIYVEIIDESGNSQRLVSDFWTNRIKKLQFTDSERKAAKCVITLDNFDLQALDDHVWSFGHRIRVSWGWPGNMSPRQTLSIRKVSGFTTLKIEAFETSVLLDRDKRTRVFEAKTHSDIVHTIAAANKFKPSARRIDKTKEILRSVTQNNITDAQFLRKLAHREQFEFYVARGVLYWRARKIQQKPTRTYTWYTDPRRGEVKSITFENDIVRKPGAVTVVCRDSRNKETCTATADEDSTQGRKGLARYSIHVSEKGKASQTVEAAESVGPTSEDETVLKQINDEQLAQAEEEALQSLPDRHTGEHISQATRPPSQENVDAEAKAKFLRTQQTANKTRLVAVGNPKQFAKEVIRLRGIGRRLSGRYYVTEAEHNVGAEYDMKLTIITDGEGGLVKSSAADGEGESTLPQRDRQESTADINDQEPYAEGEDDLLVANPVYDDQGNQIGSGYKWVQRNDPVRIALMEEQLYGDGGQSGSDAD